LSSFSAYETGVYGTLGEYGLGAKNQLSVATPEGTKIGTFPQNSANLARDHAGRYNDNCECVPISQCPNFDIITQGTNGHESISGFGQPNYGAVGYGIDPRNKLGSGIESNATETEDTESRARTALGGSDETEMTTEVAKSESGEEITRKKRDTEEKSDAKNAAQGDGVSQPV